MLKCFLQCTCTNLDGCQKERDDFLNLLQNEGAPRKGVSLRKRRVPTLEETMVCICKEGWCGELGQEGGSLRKGGVNCLKYLKRE